MCFYFCWKFQLPCVLFDTLKPFLCGESGCGGGGVPCENGYVIQLSWLIAFCDQFYQQQSAAPLLKQKIPSLLFKRVIFLILPSKMLIVCFTKVDRPGNTHNYWWGNAGFFITSRKKGRTSNHWIFLHFYIKCPWW